MANCAIVGVGWGDEGKGRMVDVLAGAYDVVIRYQGGNNAGHTIVNDKGTFKLNLVPSGVFHPGALNLLGPGMVIDLKHLCGELDALAERGVSVTPDTLRISDRASVVLPIHPEEDKMEEERLGKASYGSTRRGIAPAYADRAYKKALRMGDLLRPETLRAQLTKLVDWKNVVSAPGYGRAPFDFDEMLAWAQAYGGRLAPYVCDAGKLLEDAARAGKTMLFEAQLGALRDPDYGIYPFTSSSCPLAAFAPVGCGMPSLSVERVVGVVKAYSTCVGAGPFVGELEDETGARLREAGGEYGAATGRPRRVGWLDLVAMRYGAWLQGATELALTKLDVLSEFDELPLCVAYEMDGERVERFPYTPDLDRCKPIYEIMPGWRRDISMIRRFEDLPREARAYVESIERALETPITYVSVGAEREALMLRGAGA